MKSSSKNLLAILLLIFFFPAGLFVMWKYTTWNKKLKYFWTGLFAFFVLLGIIGNNSDTQTQQISSATPTPSSTKTTATNAATNKSTTPVVTRAPAKPQTLIQQLWIALDNAMQTRDGYKIDYDADSKTATITHSIDTAWDENALVRGSYNVLVKYGREAFKLNNVDAVRVIVRTKFTDQYGNDNWEDAVRIIMSKEEFQKFNWDNLKYRPVSEQIQAAADAYYIHPAIDAKTAPDQLYLSF